MYIVKVPELPGCISDGARYKEALKNGQVVIAGWIKKAISLDREIPSPNGRLTYA